MLFLLNSLYCICFNSELCGEQCGEDLVLLVLYVGTSVYNGAH